MIKGDIDVTMGSVDVTFVSKDVIYAIESIQPILSTLSSNASSSKSANETTNANTKLDICIKQGNVIFTSDELIPFTRLVTFNLCIKNHNTVTYNNTNVWNISSNSFELWDDSPVGHSYPDVIMPLEEEQNESSNDLIIDIILPNDHWKYPTQVHVQIHKKRIIILKRYIEELFQYMDECYGIGKVMAKLMPHSIEVDEYNNPPPPLLWFCDIKESLLILPRNSSSMDIIGLQNNDKDSVIKFGNQFVPHTWKLNDNNVSFFDYYDLHLPPKQQEERILDNQSSLTSEEFFDCLEELLDDDDNPFDIYKSYSSKNIEMDSNLKYLSSFDKSMISRLNVNIHDVRIFTSLGGALDDINETTSTSSTSIKVSDLHSFVSIKNKALPNQMVYQVVQDIIDDQNKSFSSSGTSLMQSFKELTARKWNEITNIPISFSIFVDHCPHMRLLIRTNSNNIISWNTSMSQFYLILSIWYDNMQEVILFKFTL